MTIRTVLFVLSFMGCGVVGATNPPMSSTPVSISTAQAQAEAISLSKSTAVAGGGEATAIAKGGEGGHAVASGGNSTATGGAASQSQTAKGGSAKQSQQANNAGNAQSTDIQYQAARNAPSVAQGSLMPSGCGAAGNAGGSNVNGSGFLGIAFTTGECYRFMLSQSFAAIGMPDTACDILLTTKAAKHAFKDKSMPDCTMAKNRPDPSPAVVVLDRETVRSSPSKVEVNESIDRALRRALEK